jgi:peptidoglycan/LPS O-acetylase OafA/YrhL
VFFMYCDYFFYGGVLAISIWNKRDRLEKLLHPYRHWLLLLALVILIYSSKVEFYSIPNILIFGNLVLFSGLYLLLFFLLFPYSSVGKVLELKVVRIVGTLSYSLYIWQQLFLGSAANWIAFKAATLFPYNLALVFICATCSYLLIEKPFLKMKKKYTAYS